MILLCWKCNKEHDIEYKIGNPIFCECGGTIISNSGKIMAGVKDCFKDDKKNEKINNSKSKKTEKD
jgi:hypothetical protein